MSCMAVIIHGNNIAQESSLSKERHDISHDHVYSRKDHHREREPKRMGIRANKEIEQAFVEFRGAGFWGAFDTGGVEG